MKKVIRSSEDLYVRELKPFKNKLWSVHSTSGEILNYRMTYDEMQDEYADYRVSNTYTESDVVSIWIY